MKTGNSGWRYALLVLGLALLAVMVMDFNRRTADLRRLTTEKEAGGAHGANPGGAPGGAGGGLRGWGVRVRGRVGAVGIGATSGWRWVWRELSALGFEVQLAEPAQVGRARDEGDDERRAESGAAGFPDQEPGACGRGGRAGAGRWKKPGASGRICSRARRSRLKTGRCWMKSSARRWLGAALEGCHSARTGRATNL